MSIEQSTRDQFAIAKLLIITARARARVCLPVHHSCTENQNAAQRIEIWTDITLI